MESQLIVLGVLPVLAISAVLFAQLYTKYYRKMPLQYDTSATHIIAMFSLNIAICLCLYYGIKWPGQLFYFLVCLVLARMKQERVTTGTLLVVVSILLYSFV